MRLSEAIKLGSLLGPHLKDGRLIGPGNASCAMGAALLALGVDTVEAQTVEVFDCDILKLNMVQSRLNHLLTVYFPEILTKPVSRNNVPLKNMMPFGAPFIGDITVSLHSVLWQMNDRTRFTRQEIADWLIASGYDCDSVDIQQEQHEHEAIPVTT